MKAAVLTTRVRERFSFEGLFLLILLVTIALRFYALDLKLFHHDEAIHAWFSYRLLTEGTYIYDPMYHGPFLYYTTAGIFSLLGDSDLVGRLIPALFGTVLVALVYPIYKLGYLDKKQALIAALFLAVSPNMVYFSRFLRNDIYIAVFSMVLLVALLYYFERHKMRYALLAGAAIGLGMSTKENMPIIILTFGVYLLYLVWTRKVQLPARWIRDFALGSIVAVGIMAVLYSSLGAHPEVLMDGWLRAIEHWTSMHQMQRLGGPPYFYILLFLLYEVPILVLAAVGFCSSSVSPEPSPAGRSGGCDGVHRGPHPRPLATRGTQGRRTPEFRPGPWIPESFRRLRRGSPGKKGRIQGVLQPAPEKMRRRQRRPRRHGAGRTASAGSSHAAREAGRSIGRKSLHGSPYSGCSSRLRPTPTSARRCRG